MGGTLVPDDTPGGGLTMILTLPAARSAAPAQPPAPIENQTAHPAITSRVGRLARHVPREPAMTRILVVDDEPQILRACASTCAPATTT